MGRSPAPGAATIQGFATDMSVDQGETIGFKIDTTRVVVPPRHLPDGLLRRATARARSRPSPRPCSTTSPTASPTPRPAWSTAATGPRTPSWAVPADAVSGIYFAKLVRTDGTAGASHVFFVVRDDDGGSRPAVPDLGHHVAGLQRLRRQQPLHRGTGRTGLQGQLQPSVHHARQRARRTGSSTPSTRWSACSSPTGTTSATPPASTPTVAGAELLEHKVFLSVGHDEYWSGSQRANVEAARAAGVNLAFFSGNEVFWKTRWENSIDGSGTPYRTLVTYKETHANAKIDPRAADLDRHVARPAVQPAGRRRSTRERADRHDLHGQLLRHQHGGRRRPTARCASGATPASPPWPRTQTTTIGTNVIGYEWDEDLDNGFRPPGAVPGVPDRRAPATCCRTTAATYAQRHGHARDDDLPRAERRAGLRRRHDPVVVGASTRNHDRGSAAADAAAQQATVNLFADMGVQPTTLQAGLDRGDRLDRHRPRRRRPSPRRPPARRFRSGTPVTVSGTATDTGGGRVGGVEVSTDNGTTWHRATGRESWTYTFTPSTAGTADRSAAGPSTTARNLETPSAGITVTVGTGADRLPVHDLAGDRDPGRHRPRHAARSSSA